VKAQVAIELLIITAFVFAVLIPLVAYLSTSLTIYQDQSRVAQAREVVRRLGTSADWVWFQGSPAQLTLTLCIPAGIEDSTLNKAIRLKVMTSAGITEVAYSPIVNLTGSIPTSPGCYEFTVRAQETEVSITVA
jgi:hypothetical protein